MGWWRDLKSHNEKIVKGISQLSKNPGKLKTVFKYLNSHVTEEEFRFILCGLRRQK